MHNEKTHGGLPLVIYMQSAPAAKNYADNVASSEDTLISHTRSLTY